jgi:hypothetical protein
MAMSIQEREAFDDWTIDRAMDGSVEEEVTLSVQVHKYFYLWPPVVVMRFALDAEEVKRSAADFVESVKQLELVSVEEMSSFQ